MNTAVTVVQFSDTHLFADPSTLHHGANVYQNLSMVIEKISQLSTVDLIVFTGDLSQDHSELAYQHFVDIIKKHQIKVPIYYVTGNHDEPELLTRYLSSIPFVSSSLIELAHWQIALLSSKSGTPSGTVEQKQLELLGKSFAPNKHQLLVMHHHPVDVNYFIDRHGLTNKDEFWQWVEQFPSIKQIVCGHVHNAITTMVASGCGQIPVVSCPATSIQFDKAADTVKNSGLGPAFNVYELFSNGQVASTTHFLARD
ncbi:metallophosphoesterase [Thalassotalea ganghwensis]